MRQRPLDLGQHIPQKCRIAYTRPTEYSLVMCYQVVVENARAFRGDIYVRVVIAEFRTRTSYMRIHNRVVNIRVVTCAPGELKRHHQQLHALFEEREPDDRAGPVCLLDMREARDPPWRMRGEWVRGDKLGYLS